jgi:hypothetical protein
MLVAKAQTEEGNPVLSLRTLQFPGSLDLELYFDQDCTGLEQCDHWCTL